ncbi:unnamed protein product [Sympodiomycopsis kandeliae]
MSSPLSQTPTFLKLQPVPAIIGDQVLTQPSSTSSSSTFDVVRPERGSESKIHSVVSCTPEQAGQAVDAAWKTFPSWKATPLEERRKVFWKAAELLRERSQEYAQLTVEETCLDIAFATFEILNLAIPGLEETGAVLTSALRGEFPTAHANGRRELITREPYGVVVGIAPWNAPFFLALRAILNPLAAGNTVVLKTSEQAPRTNMAVAQLLYDAGLPHGALSVVHSSPQDVAAVTETLISHPAVRKINFTGSTRVGKLVAVQAAKHLKPVVLELGGKAPQIVLEDADIAIAANNAVVGAFMNTGQVCMSTTIVLIDEKIEGKFNSEVQKIFSENRDALNYYQKAPQGRVRALFSAASAERAHGILQESLSAGGKVLAGDRDSIRLDTAQIPPLVVSGVKPSMSLFTQEAFAPILSITTFKSDDEAVKLANSNAAGLAASVYSSNEMRALQVAQQVESGQVHINSITVHDHPTIPHGGWKESGYGRFNGTEGIREFTQTRAITISQGGQLPFFIL